MLVALTALAPGAGVTTAALALATLWPGHDVEVAAVVLDADPAGGGLGHPRWGLQPHRGLATLAAELRSHPLPTRLHRLGDDEADTAWAGLLFDHAQLLPCRQPVLVSGSGPEESTAAITELTSTAMDLLERAAAAPDLVVVADCGALDRNSPALPILHTADVTLLLTPPSDPELKQATDWVTWLRRPQANPAGPGGRWGSEPCESQIGLVLTGPTDSDTAWPTPEPPAKIYGQLPDDSTGAARLHDALTSPRRQRVARDLARHPLIRAVHILAYRLDAAMVNHPPNVRGVRDDGTEQHRPPATNPTRVGPSPVARAPRSGLRLITEPISPPTTRSSIDRVLEQ